MYTFKYIIYAIDTAEGFKRLFVILGHLLHVNHFRNLVGWPRQIGLLQAPFTDLIVTKVTKHSLILEFITGY